MPLETLSQDDLNVITRYIALPFPNHTITCPYFNNRRVQARASLRVMVGKGTPEEITEETILLALRDHVDLKTLSNDTLTKFLVDHGLGVDCSGLAYHILDAEISSKTGKPLKHFLTFPFAKTPLRKLLTKLRPVENCGVKNFAHETNSIAIHLD